jgi:hypothetical protein
MAFCALHMTTAETLRWLCSSPMSSTHVAPIPIKGASKSSRLTTDIECFRDEDTHAGLSADFRSILLVSAGSFGHLKLCLFGEPWHVASPWAHGFAGSCEAAVRCSVTKTDFTDVVGSADLALHFENLRFKPDMLFTIGFSFEPEDEGNANLCLGCYPCCPLDVLE